MSRSLEIYDIECLSNLFTYTGYRPSEDKYYQFVIHELENNYLDLIKHLQDNIFQCGFNNVNYDYPVIHHMIKHYDEYKTLSGFQLSQKIHDKSNEIINMEFSAIADKNCYIPQLDLFLINHYNNKARHCSLKHLEVSMRLPNVEDMPYDHNYWINTLEEIEEVLSYNKNDVYATYEFFKICQGNTDLPLYSGKNKLQLRKDIIKQFNLPCLNWDDVKIGDKLNLLNYKKNNPYIYIQKGGTKRSSIYMKDIILPNVYFNSNIYSKFLNELKEITVNINDGKLEELNKELIYNDFKLSFGLGGIHSVDKARRIIPSDNQILEDRDCTSMHPTAILKYGFYPEHLGESWLKGYKWTFDQRVLNKKLSKDKHISEIDRKRAESIQEAYKLSLNGGGFGKTGEYNSWQHDLKVMLSVTVNNQLFLLMLIEKYFTIPNIQIISANTDGVIILFDKIYQEDINKIDKEWEEISKHTLEYTPYSKFIQTSVNDYIAQTTDGYCKFKGDFVIDRELHKNPSMIIVPIALREYFINNIPIKDTIINHNNIYDFCLMLRLIGDFKGIYKGLSKGKYFEKSISKTLRYYASNDGGYLFKIKDNNIIGVNVGQKVSLFNKYIEKEIHDYNIDYNFYINECNKIIYQIDSINTQLSLF